MVDLARNGAARFTSAPGVNADVVWSPDGSNVLFSSSRTGPRNFFIKPASGATPEQPFYESEAAFKDSRSWSGKNLVYEESNPKTNRDLWVIPVEGERTPHPYLQTPFNEVYCAVSPDGRWLAYISDESGRYEVYVDSFPTPGNKYQVTVNGAGTVSDQWGNVVFWRKDGRALAAFSGDSRRLLEWDVTPGPEFHAAATPRELVALPRGTAAAAPTPDFQRTLAAVPASGNSLSTLTVVFNWRGAIGK
jgi:Tol biopolymer transport system component